MADEKTVLTKASLTWAQVILAALGVAKEFALTFLAALVQYERIKQKKTEDRLELMKAEKRIDDEQKVIQTKADATDARRGINEFLQR